MCFTQVEAEAAHLRALQQQFNVAALNCQTTNPEDPTFTERYNRFIRLFSKELQDNSDTLYRHFGKDGRALDRWMTRVANLAGQSVIRNPDFCQVAWDRLEEVAALAPAQLRKYVVLTEAAGDLAPACVPEKKTPSAVAERVSKSTLRQ